MKNTMNKRRIISFMTAIFMVICFIGAGLPVSAAGMSAEFTVYPKTISAGDSISADISIKGAAVGNGTATVTVQGLGSFSGSYEETDVQFTDGAAQINVPSGNISYSGKDSPAHLQVLVGGETVTSPSISNISPIPDDSGDDTPAQPPVIAGNIFTIVEDTPIPTVNAGEQIEVTYPIQSSKRISGDVQITATLPDQVYFTTASSTQTFSYVRQDTQKYTIGISADSEMKSGTYPVTISVKYKYASEAKEETITTYIKVVGKSGEEQQGDLLVSGYSVSPMNVKAGSNFKLSVTIHNSGNKATDKTLVSLSGSSLSTEAFTMNGTLDSMQLGSLSPNQVQTLTFSLCSNEKMETGNYILDVVIGEGETATTSKVFIPVTGNPEAKDDEKKNESTPQLIIDSYNYGEGVTSVTGGEVFTLTATILNTGKTAVKNVKMTISSAADEETGGAFSPANSSNTFYMESIPAGGKITQTIDLLPKADAKPKSYGVDFAFSYEAIVNDELVTKDITQTIAIPLTQPDRFEVAEPQMYGPVMQGETLNGYVSYVNKGKSTIFNLSMKVEGEGFTTAETETYIGNVESGSSDGYDISINPTQAGTVNGTITFTYEDANGDTKNIVKNFQAEVMEYVEPEIPDTMDPDIPVEAEGGIPVWGWIAIAGAGVVVLIVVIVVVKKVVKKKKQAAMDAEDDYDDDDNTGE
ncbi:MAG: CARDB domain-containing protein [Candidatus Merdivicinus sp.]|jgi:hypothetical protein